MEAFEKYVNSLPQPLSKEEQKVLLRRYCVTKDKEARELLISHNLRLVAHCVSKFNNLKVDKDELMQVGTVELIKCLDKFDISLGFEFSTFAYKSITLKLLSEINKGKKLKDAMYRLQDNVFIEDDEEINILDRISDDKDIESEVGFKDIIDRFCYTLNEEEKYIFINNLGLYGNKALPVEEIAKNLNKNQTTTSKVKEKILQKFRLYYLGIGKESEKSEIPDAVVEYLKTATDPEEIFLLESRYGLNGQSKLSLKEMALELGIVYSTASKHLSNLLKKLNIETENDVNIEDIARYLSTSTNKKERLVAEHFFGLNNKKRMSRKEIETAFGIHRNTVHTIILYLRRKIRVIKAKEAYTDESLLINTEKVMEYYKTCKNDRHKLILEYRYGLNGKEQLSLREIAERVQMKPSNLTSMLNYLKKRIQLIEINNQENQKE